MKSSSIIDQYSTSGDDELNDEAGDTEDSEDDADVINDNRVTRQAPESGFKSAGSQAFKTSCTEVMNFVAITYCNLQHVLPEHQGNRGDVQGGDARASGASDGRVSATSWQPGGARKIDIREYLSDVCGEINNDERHENQCGLLESAMAFRMSTLNRFDDLDLCKEFLARFERAGKVQDTAEKVAWKRQRSQQRP